jgi:hypothetical protein
MLKSPSLQEALVKELLSYAFSSLREGDLALYRGAGNGLAPILLLIAKETSPGCAERLEHEYALKIELDVERPLLNLTENLMALFSPVISVDGRCPCSVRSPSARVEFFRSSTM